ncbi:MAG: carbonic anhydrase [Patescibacteria group bacterium]
MNFPFLYQNQHHAQAVALFCMDFRFKDATLEFLKHEMQLTDLDIIVLAGAAKNLAAPQDSFDFKVTLKQFELSSKLHQIKKMVLIDHQDCGAYGGSAVFETSKAEREVHVINLRKAGEVLRQKFPDKEIILFYAQIIEKEIKFERIK